MSFMDEVMHTAVSVKNKSVEKAGQLKEVMLLKSRVDTCDEVINKSYMELGKKYFELYGEEAEEAFAKYCRDIKNAQRGKEEIGQQLAEAKERLKGNK